MKCPFCSSEDDRVIDSRLSKDAKIVRRRRQCNACNRRFTTIEKVILSLPLVIKKDGRREVFDRQKLLNGLMKACEKRPVSLGDIEEIVQVIEKRVEDSNLKEVRSDEIGRLALTKLKDIDAISYVRFASVYLSFKDINELYETVSELIEKNRIK